MNEWDPKEMNALINLLDDPDTEVFLAVSNKLLELGESVIPPLEKRWEISLKPELQARIETIIRQIQFHAVKSEMKTWKETGGEDLLYGAYLLSRFHYPELDFEPMDQQVETIRKDIWLELNNQLTALEKVHVINYFLYDIHRFDQRNKNLVTPRYYFLNYLLDTRKGNSVMLGLLYAELARRLELPVYGVNIPRNFMLGYYDPEYPDDPDNILFYINPLNRGAVMGREELARRLRQQKIHPKPSYFSPCAGIEIIERIGINLQYAYEQSGQHEHAVLLKEVLYG